MIELKFGSPREVYTDNAYDGRRFEFSYSITYKVHVPEKDNINQKKAIVSISYDLLSKWLFQSDNDLTKVLFHVFVFPHISIKLIKDNLSNIERLDLHTNVVDKKAVYDPNKLLDFVERIFPLDIEELRKDKVKLGF